MSITITLAGETIALPSELHWADEYAWTPVIQSTEYSLTGALIVQEGARQAGRPVTLTTPMGGDWVPRETVERLRGWLSTVEPMTLTLHDARALTVAWRHGDGPLEARPMLDGLSTPTAGSTYLLTLRLIEV